MAPVLTEGLEETTIVSIIGLAICVLGFFGNSCAAVTTRVEKLENTSSGVLLCGQVLSDIMLLVFVSLRHISNIMAGFPRIEEEFGVITLADMMHGGATYRCRLSIVFEGIARIVSPWLSVAMLTEVIMGVYYFRTTQQKQIYHPNRATYVTGYIYFLAFVSVISFGIIVEADSNGQECTSTMMEFFTLYYYCILDIVLHHVLPYVTILTTFLMFLMIFQGVENENKMSEESSSLVELKHEFTEKKLDVFKRLDRPFTTFAIWNCILLIIFTLPKTILFCIDATKRFDTVRYEPDSVLYDISPLARNIIDVVWSIPFASKCFVVYTLETDFSSNFMSLDSILQKKVTGDVGQRQTHNEGVGFKKSEQIGWFQDDEEE